MMILTIIDEETLHELMITDCSEYEGWYCVSIHPERCKCGRLIGFLEPDLHHLVLVWEENDDEELLSIAAHMKREGYDPHIVEYKSPYGPCVEYYEAKEADEVQWLTH